MERIEQQEDLVDLGSVVTETKGLPMGDEIDVAGPRFQGSAGLSNE